MSTAGQMLAKERRKSDRAAGMITLAVPGDRLRAIFAGPSQSLSLSLNLSQRPSKTKDSESGSAAASFATKDDDAKDTDATSPSSSTLLHAPASQDNAFESTPTTPAREGTQDASQDAAPDGIDGTPAAMAPPAGDAAKKKGVKRSAMAAGVDGAANGSGPGSVNGDTAPKVRSKPGPKKKQKTDDVLDAGRGGAGGAHKLGPKASMGAINAGLRALDRSGKPCRRWAKGGFTLKTFTGVVWEIPRWTAPPRPAAGEDVSAEASTTTASADDGSNKENGKTDKKDASSVRGVGINGINGINGANKAGADGASVDMADTSDKVTADGDVEMSTAPPSAQPSPPPASMAVAVA